MPTGDPDNARAKARSIYAHRNRAEEVTLEPDEGQPNGDSTVNGTPFILDISAVTPTGGDHAVSASCRHARLRTLESA